MWWILPWLVFLGCLAALAVTHAMWRHRQLPDAHNSVVPGGNGE